MHAVIYFALHAIEVTYFEPHLEVIWFLKAKDLFNHLIFPLSEEIPLKAIPKTLTSWKAAPLSSLDSSQIPKRCLPPEVPPWKVSSHVAPHAP